MENLLGNIYCWFQSLFGQDLSYYLWGYNPETEGFDNPNIYNFVGIITIPLTLLIVLIFYYVIAHPKYCKWWSWLITMGLTGLVSLFIAYGIVKSKWLNGYIHDSLMYLRDESGEIVSVLIGETNCWGFGIANMIISFISFVIFTLIFKWTSRQLKYVPF